MEKRLCPHDGSIMQKDARPLTLTYQGCSATDQAVPGWYCTTCDEAFFESKGSQIAARLLNKIKAKVACFLPPPEIRRIRKKLKLTQKDAGLIIGGGVRAFQKYESGDLLPSQGIDSALRLLDHDPAQLSVLRARNPEKRGRARNHPPAVFHASEA
ncbi:MAG: type II toxin-antitoxin system MqsA family antitoxin [Alphaproteobacteria bacterium]|nr:type II toxin-antitoxin system MqsA family antitoxin [Alphaproteobacteria bacterium]